MSTKVAPKTKKIISKSKTDTKPESKIVKTEKVVPNEPVVEKVAPVVDQVPPKESSEQPDKSIEKVEEDSVANRFSRVLTSLNEMKKQCQTLIDEVKKLQKEKRKTRNTNVKSGFVKQVPISSDLATFMKVKEDELVSRVTVTKFVTDYVSKNNLQVSENKQLFNVDKALSNLFNVDVGTQIHYFKLQSHLKNHYPKVETTPTVLVTA